MSGERRRQSVFPAEEIDRPGLTIILAEYCRLPLVVRRKVLISAADRAHHFLPTKLVGKQLRQDSRMRGLGPRWLEMNCFHVGRERLRPENRDDGGSDESAEHDNRPGEE